MIESNPCLFHNLPWKCIWFTPTLWGTWLGHKIRSPIINNFVVDVFYIKVDLWVGGGYRGHGNDWYDSGGGQMAGPYEHGNGAAGSIIAGILLASWGTVALSRRAVLCVVSLFLGQSLMYSHVINNSGVMFQYETGQTRLIRPQDMVWHS